MKSEIGFSFAIASQPLLFLSLSCMTNLAKAWNREDVVWSGMHCKGHHHNRQCHRQSSSSSTSKLQMSLSLSSWTWQKPGTESIGSCRHCKSWAEKNVQTRLLPGACQLVVMNYLMMLIALKLQKSNLHHPFARIFDIRRCKTLSPIIQILRDAN